MLCLHGQVSMRVVLTWTSVNVCSATWTSGQASMCVVTVVLTWSNVNVYNGDTDKC